MPSLYPYTCDKGGTEKEYEMKGMVMVRSIAQWACQLQKEVHGVTRQSLIGEE